MISAGKFDQLVTPLFPIVHGNGTMGEQIVEWQRGNPRHAKVDYLRGKSALTSGDAWLISSIVVTLRYTRVITDHCRLMWQGRTYRIVAPPEGSLRSGDMTIHCESIDEGTTEAVARD